MEPNSTGRRKVHKLAQTRTPISMCGRSAKGLYTSNSPMKVTCQVCRAKLMLPLVPEQARE